MGLLDSLIASGMFPSASGAPAAPPAGLLNLNPEDQQDLIIDPTTGVAVRSGVARRGQFPAVASTMTAMQPSTPALTPSPAFGALAPPAPQVAEVSPAPVPVPMPKPRPDVADKPTSAEDDGEDDDDEIPAKAQPTSGQSPDVAAPDGSLLDRLGKTLSNNSNLLLGLGAGFAGAPSLGAGLSRGFAGASAGSQLDQRQALQQQAILAQNNTARALVAKGEDPSVAIAAIGNPALMKALVDKHFAANPLQFKTIKDSFGNERVVGLDPYDSNAAAKANGAGENQNQRSNDIQSISDRIQNKRAAGATQSDLLQEIPSAYRNDVQALVEGRAIPANMGRGAMRAQYMLLAHALDPNFDESLIPQRMKYAQGIANTAYTAPGGQRQAIDTGIGHTANLAESLVAMNNTNGPSLLSGVPGSGYLAQGANAVANSSNAMQGNVSAVDENADRAAGELGKLYSGNQGGGVNERDATRARFSHNLSPIAAAGALRATKANFLEKVQSNENERDQAFGPNSVNRIDFRDADVQRNLHRIDVAISKLDPTGPEARALGMAQTATTAAPAAVTPGLNRTSNNIPWSIVGAGS